MRMGEVWQGVLDSHHTPIDRILYYEANLPRPFDGLFVRLGSTTGEGEAAAIYVYKDLPDHWKEFVAIKEMMHCFTPGKHYTGTPREAQLLVEALCSKTSGRYGASVAADNSAILAAAEVILPHYTVERYLKQGKEVAQIAVEQGLHPDLAEMICRFDMLQRRKNGEL
ncbi:hypothetical protein BMI86_20030 [Thioclava sp. DLFJ5-1]|nr:hypothetical protein BMI86_20030 [Thioclava sp. DLFJ5-1]